MRLIETKTLESNQASVIFSSIPQNFTDLILLISARSSRSLALDDCFIVVNNITSGYTGRGLDGNGTTTSAFANAGASDKFYFMSIVSAATATSNTFSNSSVYIPNYSGSAVKTISCESVTENNSTESYTRIAVGLLDNTAPITSLTLTPGVGPNFITGSMFSLYGVLKGSDGIVTTS